MSIWRAPKYWTWKFLFALFHVKIFEASALVWLSLEALLKLHQICCQQLNLWFFDDVSTSENKYILSEIFYSLLAIFAVIWERLTLGSGEEILAWACVDIICIGMQYTIWKVIV